MTGVQTCALPIYVPFGFGKVTYDTVGKYSYTVTEENAGQTINGVTYSKNEAKIIVDVSDPGNGQLTANIQSYSTIFINEYGASLNLGAAGGLAITKTVTGHALAKEQFEFKVKAVKTDTATADEAAELFGFKEGETEDRKSTRLNSSHCLLSRMPSSA